MSLQREKDLEVYGHDLVEVYDKVTGRPVTVPNDWLDNPVLFEPFRKTPLNEKQQRAADAAVAKANDDTPAAGDKE